MSTVEHPVLADQLRALSGLHSKRDIQVAATVFAHQPFPELGVAALLGDDAALLPAQRGGLLLACEGMHPDLVDEDPWFAGWSAVLVNLSDIAAMVFPVVHSCDRISALVELIEIAGFKKVLLFAKDRTAQLPVTIDQGGSRP